MIFNSVVSGIITQCLLGISIISACLPALKIVSDAFDFGMVAMPVKPVSTTYGLNSYEMKASANGEKRSAVRSLYVNGKDKLKETVYEAAITSHRSGSVDSERSDKMIIKRTDQWDISYENCHSQSTEEPRRGSEHSV